MPITDIQVAVLQVIAKNRSLDSYVAGATVIHAGASSPRISKDLDIFHDDSDAVPRSAKIDVASLEEAGFAVQWLQQLPAFHKARVQREADIVEIDWAADSAYRFFPLEPDPVLGFRLHPLDAATNKVLAFVGRLEPRDLVDCIYLHRSLLSLGALVWAACAKDQGYTPDLILKEAERRARFRVDDLRQVYWAKKPPDPVKLRHSWGVAVAKAHKLVETLPVEELGCLYLDKTGKAVTPNPRRPAEFRRLQRHRGSVRGVLPVVHEPHQKSQ